MDGRGGGEMLVVETIARIRRDHLVKGVPIKKLARDLRVSRNTIRKVVRGDATSHTYERTIQPMPKLGPWVEELERQLEANEKKPRRDRLSLLRIYEDLGGSGLRRRLRRGAPLRQGLAPAAASVGALAGLRASELRPWRGLPVRLEPRVRAPGGCDDPGEGRAHAALLQPDAAGPDLPARRPGDGVRGARALLPLLRRGLPAGHLRQHEDGRDHGLCRQEAGLQPALPGDVLSPPGGACGVHARGWLGEGAGGEAGG